MQPPCGRTAKEMRRTHGGDESEWTPVLRGRASSSGTRRARLHGGMKGPRAISRPSWRSRTGLVLAAFLAIAAYYLVTEHRAHLVGPVPFILVLLVTFGLLYWMLPGTGARGVRHGGS